MLTILIENGVRLFFFENESNEPVHVHVDHQGARAKFWVRPVRLAQNLGMSGATLAKAADIVSKHETFIWEKWHEFARKKS